MEERKTSTEQEWEVYVLKCADNTLYTGIARDADKRCAVHNSKKGAKYTRSRTPVSIVYREPCTGYGNALKREAEIKRMSRRNKLNLIGERDDET